MRERANLLTSERVGSNLEPMQEGAQRSSRVRSRPTSSAPAAERATLLAQQRQAFILARLREYGGVRVADLARDLDVSDMTVRRDLEQLEERGLLEKVHGGATALPGGTAFEPAFATKARIEQAEKQGIAVAAAARVEPGMAICLSAGTTTFAVANRLVDCPRITVVTNSVPVADAFYHGGRPDQTIILTGGVRTPSDALVGPYAVATLRSLHVDLVFMGVHGMDPGSGFTCPNVQEADVDRALIEAGRRLAVVADHTKWGTIGISSIARLDQADLLITDSALGGAARELLADQVKELVVVDPLPAPRRAAMRRVPTAAAHS